jgi:hypothetical protein
MDFYNIRREEVYSKLKSLEPLSIATHRDADGIYSGVLFSKIFKVEVVNVPDRFGDYNEIVSLDLGSPIREDYFGYVFDHHEHRDPKYALIHDQCPVGKILYDLFKDKIPPEYTWLVSGSLVGDGQPELIPSEIFREHPILLEEYGTLYRSYGEIKHYRLPLYKLLSSPINATCRLGKGAQAFSILSTIRSPEEVIEHPLFISDQIQLEKEEESILNEFGKGVSRRKTITIGPFTVLVFGSNYFMAGRIGSLIQNSDPNLTVIAINEELGEISVRGPLSSSLREMMNPLGWDLGGHPGYMGGELGSRSPKEFLKDLRRCVYGKG